MKKALKIFAIVIVVLFALSIVKDLAVKISVESGVQFVTGLKLRINNFNVGIARQIVNIGGLKLYNPKGFKDRVMLDMPRIYVDYDLGAIFKGVVHLEEVRLNMKELVVVKNEKGELNLDSLNVVKGEKVKKGAAAKPADTGKQGKVPSIKIDKLHLKIDKAAYKDYSKGGAPDVKEFNVNIDETYTNINDLNALVGLIVVRALTNTTISSLANFDLKGLSVNVNDTLTQAQQVAEQATTVASDSVKAVKETTSALQNVLKNPFGK